MIQLLHEESKAGRTAVLVVADQPDVSLPELNRRYEEIEDLEEEDRGAAIQRLREQGLVTASRMVVGRVRDGSCLLSLAAADGTNRIVLAVTADGTPSIRFLDADQNVTWQAP